MSSGPYRARTVLSGPPEAEFAYSLAEQIQREGARLREAGLIPSQVTMGHDDYVELLLELESRAARVLRSLAGRNLTVFTGGHSCPIGIDPDLKRGHWFIICDRR